MMVAGFARKQDLQAAIAALRGQDVGIETFTPVPLHTDTPDAVASPLPLLMLVTFILSAGGMFGLQVFADTVGYPINIGGKPNNSWPAFIPNAFELGVLATMAMGVLGYFAINRMPRYYHPVDRSVALRAASRDGWFVSITNGDPDGLRTLLADHHARSIEYLPDDPA